MLTNHPKSTRSLPIGTITKRRKKVKKDKTKIGVGTSVTVKIGGIDEKIGEVESIRMRKYLVGYLAQIYSFLLLSNFWWLVNIF